MSKDTLVPEVGGRVLWYRDDQGRPWIGGWRDPRNEEVFAAAEQDLLVLAACNGERGVAQLAYQAGVSVQEAECILRKWEARIPASFCWKPPRVDDKLAKQQAIALDMLRESRAVEGHPFVPDNRNYHRRSIINATHQFDDVETTVSHAYSAPHPALGGLTYGEAFFERCSVLGAIQPGMSILEIGCGTGRFARAFLDAFAARLPEIYDTVRYTMFDLAPMLTSSQRAITAPHAERVAFENGDVEAHSFSQRFDLVIANEMIADLSVEIVDKRRPWETPCIKKYSLSCENALRRFLVNAGAIRLLEQVACVLRPGGYGVVTEYGSRDAFPVAVKLGDHTEFSIHFGHLEQVARHLGLEARCESLQFFLPFDLSCHVIAEDSLALLRRLSQRIFGRKLSPLAYTSSQLRETVGAVIDRLGHLRFVPIADPESEMSPSAFQVLQLFRS